MTINASAAARPPRPSAPIVPSAGALHPLGIDEVRITGGFWGERQRLNATTILRHAHDWMERLGWIGNFEAALEGRLPHDRRGREFADSDVYKLMEAMAWEVGRTGDPDVDRRFAALADLICPVQEDDGYLNTMFGRPGQAARYSDLAWGHELYCYGHLIQAAIARERTVGRDPFVATALRAADHVCEAFGPEGLDGIGGHPEIEMALTELFRVTGERRYLDQASRFIERRGHGWLGKIEFGPAYFQDDEPVRDADVLRGHAVRSLYLSAGAVDVGVETGDPELVTAVQRQWDATLARRTYLTGGMGARHEGESFGEDFQLPPDRSYSETCAGVGAVMVGHRLLLADGDLRHGDLIERVLFNVVAASPSDDGRAFFYTNTLHQRATGAAPEEDAVSPRANANLRAPWFDVSCCPTNVARTLAALGTYVATKDADGVQLIQYTDASLRTTLADGEIVQLEMTTDYPDDGRVVVRVLTAPNRDWSLSLRVPGWAKGATLTVGAETRPTEPGEATLNNLRPGDQAILELPVAARWSWADPRIDAVRDQVAVERGPLVYCLESVDLADDVATARVDASAPRPSDVDGGVAVRVRGEQLGDRPWPYDETPPDDAVRRDDDFRSVALIPYHRWGNRGPATMRVWIPIDRPVDSDALGRRGVSDRSTIMTTDVETRTENGATR